MSVSFLRRFWMYLRERYPLAQFVPFHLLLVAAVGGISRVRLGAGWKAEQAWSAEHLWAHGALAMMLVLIYFVLRVMDEHKDRVQDLAAYPERVLSRGLVTHRHLRRAAWAAAAGAVLLALPFGWPMLVGVAVVLGYALLMLREFFVGGWLRERLLLYGVGHNLIVLLSVLLVGLGFGLAEGSGPGVLVDPVFLLAALGLNGLVFSLEVARKVRLPEAERPEVDTYSKTLGVRRAALLVPAVQAASVAAFWPLPLGPWRWAALGATVLGVVVAVVRFLQRPTERGAERLVVPASVAALVAFAVLATVA